MFLITLLAVLAALSGPIAAAAPPADAVPELGVIAAASLRDALKEAAPACERSEGVKLFFNLGASNDLAHQIEAADKGDIFFSADESWMDKLASLGLVDAESRRTLLSNRLVVIGRADATVSIASASDLAKEQARFISI